MSEPFQPTFDFQAAGELHGRAAERAHAARACSRRVETFDPEAAEARLEGLGLAGREAA